MLSILKKDFGHVLDDRDHSLLVINFSHYGRYEHGSCIVKKINQKKKEKKRVWTLKRILLGNSSFCVVMIIMPLINMFTWCFSFILIQCDHHYYGLLIMLHKICEKKSPMVWMVMFVTSCVIFQHQYHGIVKNTWGSLKCKFINGRWEWKNLLGDQGDPKNSAPPDYPSLWFNCIRSLIDIF